MQHCYLIAFFQFYGKVSHASSCVQRQFIKLQTNDWLSKKCIYSTKQFNILTKYENLSLQLVKLDGKDVLETYKQLFAIFRSIWAAFPLSLAAAYNIKQTCGSNYVCWTSTSTTFLHLFNKIIIIMHIFQNMWTKPHLHPGHCNCQSTQLHHCIPLAP